MNESHTKIHLHNGESLEDYARQVQELFAEGDAYSAKSNSPKIAEVGEKLRALGQAHNDPVTDAWGILYGGMSHSILRQFDEALTIFKSVLQSFDHLGVKAGTSRTLLNIGRIYSATEKLEDAKAFYEQALAIELERENMKGLTRVLANMATLYSQLHLYREIQDIREQAFPIIERSGDKWALALMLNHASITAMVHLSELQQALEYSERALKICIEIGDTVQEAIALDGIGAAYW